MTAPTVHADTTSPQTIEANTRCWLIEKGFDNNTQKWIKTGVWSRTGGTAAAVTLTHQVTSDGAGLTWFTAPQSTSVQTVVLQCTVTAASGETGTGSTTVTIPPWQT